MRYIFLDESGQLLDGQGSTLSNGVQEEHKPSVLWVTGDSVTLLEVKIPTRNSSALEQSLPYAVEEHILSDIDKMHFSWFPVAKGKPLPVAAVTKDSMAVWKESLKRNDLRPTQLVPDIFLAPWLTNKWTLLITANRAILRTSEFQGVSGSYNLVAEYLKNNQKGKEDLEVILLPSVKLPAIWKGYKPMKEEQAESLLAEQYHQKRKINLLQGNYGSGFGTLRKLEKMYLPLVAAIVVFALLLSIKVFNYIDLKTEKQQIDDLIVFEAESIVSDFTQGDPLRPLINRRVQQHKEKLEKKQYSGWSILEKATPLLSRCSNCVYERIALEENGFSFDVGSFSSLSSLEQIVKDLKNYKVETNMRSDTRDGNAYYLLTVKIEAKG